MPKDARSKQQFQDVGSPSNWDSTSTDPEAGKVWLAGGSIDTLDLTGPKNGNTALIESTIFSVASSAWATIVAFTASEIGEFRLWRAGNTSTNVVARIQFRFAAHTAFVDHPLAANGGAMNENQIGAYEYGTAGEDLQVRLHTTATTVYGGVKFQRIPT